MTLIEMMITVAIAGILLGASAPSVNGFITKNQVASQVNRLVGVINIARSYAITRKVVMTLCPSANGLSCSKNWSQGQILFTDKNHNRIKDNDDQIIKVLPKLPDNHLLTWKVFQNKKYLQYSPTGITRYQNGTFRYCVDGENLTYNRALIVSVSGRVRLSQDTNGDGVHEDRDGKPVICR